MPDGRAAAARAGKALWLALVVLVALNLRPFLTAIGPLAEAVRADTALDYRGMAWLTLLPMLLMGLCAFAAPALQRHLGTRRVLLGALLLLGGGSALRLIRPSGTALIATAAVCGLGVALVQAVFPGVIKERFSGRVASVAGLYSAALMGGGALGARLTPLAVGWLGDWRAALAGWALPAWLALLFAWCVLPARQARGGPASPALGLLRRPRTWLLMACFGLMNGGYASLVAWLAPYYQARGWGAARSGGLIALMSIAQAGAALLPALARGRDRRPWLWLTLVLQGLGFAGFALWPELAPRGWALLCGIGLGGCFPLFLVVALEHLPDPGQAGALGALMQGGGFSIAAAAPWLTATLHAASGSFASGWLAHLACVTLVGGMVTLLSPASYALAMSGAAPPEAVPAE